MNSHLVQSKGVCWCSGRLHPLNAYAYVILVLKLYVKFSFSAIKCICLLNEWNVLFIGSRNFPNRVSFSANVNSTHLTLGAEQTVKYDIVLTNDGNGYDDRSGIFTCPVAGTYLFVVDSLSHPGIWLKLKVNKHEVARLHVSSHIKDKNILTQISRTVILKLKLGDHVKVENTAKNGEVFAHRYSGFSGTLLYWTTFISSSCKWLYLHSA